MVKNPPVNAGDKGGVGLIPGSGRSPRGGTVNPFQYSCLENSMDRGFWHAAVHWGGKESDTTEHAHTETNASFQSLTNAGFAAKNVLAAGSWA